MYKRQIVCLANSRKPPNGHCIAGKTIGGETPNSWVRPISSRATHEVSDLEVSYGAGGSCSLLDVMTVDFINPCPMGHQTENEILNPNIRWRKNGKASWQAVTGLVDNYDANFWGGSHSMGCYRFDRHRLKLS